MGIDTLRSFSWYAEFSLASRVFLAFNLLLVVAILYLNYRRADSPGARGQIRLVALGGGLTAILFVTFTVLPDVILQQTIIPYRFAFVILSLLPLTYAYAIFRLHWIEIEQHVNRGATFLLVYSILGGIYLVLYAVLQRILPGELIESPLAITFMVVVLASLLVPLSVRVKRFVDTMFYSGWYDYRLAVTQITQGLEQITTDLHTLARTIGERVMETLRLQEATVFLRDPEGDFSVIEVASRNRLENRSPPSYSALPRSSLTYLLEIGVIERATLARELSQVALYPEELQLLEKEQIHLWVPIIGRGQIQGLLALGPKLGGDVFSGEDMDILRLVARQLGPLIENLHLLTRLRQHALQLEERVKERTAELHNAKERVEAILSSVGEGVIVTDLEGRILTVNAAYESQSGFLASEVIHKNFQDLVAEDTPSQTLDEMEAALARAEVWSGDLISRRKSGELFDVQLTVAPVRDQSGQIVSYVGSQRDITRQKELDRMKDVFVADVSHELRTPTTNIGLYLELLETAPVEKRSQYMSIIKQQSLLLTKLVEDILDLSRLARAKVTNLEFICIDLNALIEQVIVAHSALAEASKNSLRFEPLTNLAPVRAEPNQISRMIQNLVSNAIRYTQQGKVTVRTDQLNNCACVIVRDTGVGVPSEDLPHIFERFYRGRNVRQSKIHGTGLGLAIVKEIVDLHGGSIEVQSEYGKGTTITVWLPLDS
jgi:PAS domain S-box-containing protein